MLTPVIPVPIRSGCGRNLPDWAIASMLGICGLFLVTLGFVIWHWWRNP